MSFAWCCVPSAKNRTNKYLEINIHPVTTAGLGAVRLPAVMDSGVVTRVPAVDNMIVSMWYVVCCVPVCGALLHAPKEHKKGFAICSDE